MTKETFKLADYCQFHTSESVSEKAPNLESIKGLDFTASLFWALWELAFGDLQKLILCAAFLKGLSEFDLLELGEKELLVRNFGVALLLKVSLTFFLGVDDPFLYSPWRDCFGVFLASVAVSVKLKKYLFNNVG